MKPQCSECGATLLPGRRKTCEGLCHRERRNRQQRAYMAKRIAAWAASPALKDIADDWARGRGDKASAFKRAKERKIPRRVVERALYERALAP